MDEEVHHQGFRDDSYRLSGLPDPAAELARLERQARIALPLELGFLERLALPDRGAILDVGCGPGVFSEALATLVPKGRVIGVDAEHALVARGRKRLALHHAERVRLVHASADALPFDAREFDLSYARFLFQHLPRPQEVLSEMARVVRPGGRVVVVDTDDGGLVIHPEPAGLPALLRASQAAQQRRGGDRHVGRKLRQYFQDAGLVDVSIEVVPFTTQMVGMSAFLDICLGFKSHIIDEELPQEDVQATLEAARSLIGAPHAFGHALAYVAVGHVPG